MQESIRIGDVVTMSKRGQWVNRVDGEEDLSQGYATKEEAIEAGRQRAEAAGTRHVVIDSDPTGAITDEQEGGQERDADAARDGENGDDGDDDVIEVEDLP